MSAPNVQHGMGTGGNLGAWVYPTACAHGVHWSAPCAACGRGYPAPIYAVAADPTIRPLLLLIARALVRLVDSEPSRRNGGDLQAELERLMASEPTDAEEDAL